MQKTLEQEFREYKERHMNDIIESGLRAFEKDNIYSHRFLKDYIDLDLTGKEKAQYVVKDLCNKVAHGEVKLYNQIYEMCWRKQKNLIRDDRAYRLD